MGNFYLCESFNVEAVYVIRQALSFNCQIFHLSLTLEPPKSVQFNNEFNMKVE